jgi:hypothetical protein
MDDAALYTLVIATDFAGIPGNNPFTPPFPLGGATPLGTVATDPGATREAVAGGFGLFLQDRPQVLTQYFDDIVAEFGPRLYEVMDLDATLKASADVLDEAVLAERVQLTPAVVRQEQEGAVDEDPSDPEIALSEEVADYCRRLLDGVSPPANVVSWNLLKASRFGARLAEKVYAPGTGPDLGRLVLASLKTKPRWAYNLVVDAFMNVVGVLAFVPAPYREGEAPPPAESAPSGWLVLPRRRFCLATWDSPHEDPRGTSTYRTAYRAWNVKVQVDPLYYRYLTVYAGAKAWAELPPNAGTQKVLQPDGSYKTPQQDLSDTLTSFLTTHSTLALHNGGAVHAFAVPGEGQAFTTAYDVFNRQLVLSQLGTADLTMPSEHYSKGEGEVGQDVVGNRVRHRRAWLADVWRREVLMDAVALNWGEDVARRHTPLVSFGSVEHQDFSRNANAVARLMQSGYFTESQLHAVDRWLGLPPRKPGELPLQAAMAQQLAAQKPQPGATPAGPAPSR